MEDKTAWTHSEADEAVVRKAVPDGVRRQGGVLLSTEGMDGLSLKVGSDGYTVLLPQPTDDPDDPLNWSWLRKHLVLLTVAWAALCTDFNATAGSAIIFQQGELWHISPNRANDPNAINVLFNGIGGLLWVPLTSTWGRAPVLFWTTVAGFAVSLGTAAAPNYETYFVMRVLSGFFLTSGQTISIAFLRDIFFLHERARKIGLWAVLYIASPYLGPCLANFVISGTGYWPDVYWMGSGAAALQLLLILAFVDETWYNRDVPDSDQPIRHRGLVGRFMRLTGMWQLKHHKTYFLGVPSVFKRFFTVFMRPSITLICFAYFLCFTWAIGINISTNLLFSRPKEVGGYEFSTRTIGYLYFINIGGVVLGEIFGHYFNDYVARSYVKRHNGVFEPEVRLWTTYISIGVMVPALILIGQLLQRTLPLVAIIFGLGMFAFGVMTMSVSVTAYGLDSYPTVPAEIGGWLNFARTSGGFAIGYFQEPWLELVGADVSFGTQAGIVAFATIPIMLTHIYGPRLRKKYPIVD